MVDVAAWALIVLMPVIVVAVVVVTVPVLFPRSDWLHRVGEPDVLAHKLYVHRGKAH